VDWNRSRLSGKYPPINRRLESSVGMARLSERKPRGWGQLGRRWRGLTYRNKVNAIAALVAVTTGIGTGALLLAQPISEQGTCPAPSGKESTCPAPGETTKTTSDSSEKSTGEDAPTSKSTKTIVVEQKTSVGKPDESLLGRAVDNTGGVILIRLAMALLAAFLSGLIVQRIALGKYGVKLPFGMGEFAEISDEQTSAVTAKAEKDPKLGSALEASKQEGADPNLLLLDDPRLELIALRRQVENQLRAKAEDVAEVDAKAPIGQLIDDLGEKEVIGPQGRSALRDVIELGDEAAEGTRVEPEVKSWLTEEGQHLPGAIEKL
jgi:hypothetical protein